MAETGADVCASLVESDVELLRLVAAGLTLETVGRRLDRSERTVRRRLRALCDELEVDSPVQAVVWAVRAGLI